MSVRLIVGPAASGKTAHVLALARASAQGLRAIPIVVVASALQAHAWRRRLAEVGGAIGVRVLTFDRLYAECLVEAGEAYTELSEPVQYRLLRSVVDGLALEQYAPLVARPGFVQVLAGLVAELKAARIGPERFAAAVGGIGGEPRLQELARVYAAYQARLHAEGWADPAGLGWTAVAALEERAPEVGRGWPLVVVDGFDDLTGVQLALLRVLGGRVGELVVTLTRTADGGRRPLAHRRADRTRELLEQALGVTAQPIPVAESDLGSVAHPKGEGQGVAQALRWLEDRLFRGGGERLQSGTDVELVEAPDRAGEVREALRWLKARVVLDGMRPRELALLMRNVAEYRPLILQTAEEFGLPVRVVAGLPLRSNPAVAALLDLMRLALPRAADDLQPALPRRQVVEAWRSPYFDWTSALEEDDEPPAAGADALDAAGRWGRVIGGLAQWREVLEHLASRRVAEHATEDEDQQTPAEVPVGVAAAALRDRFERFVRRITPPQGPLPMRTYVGWLEDLIGADPMFEPDAPVRKAAPHMAMVSRAREGSAELAERDIAALQMVKDLLSGLVWSEEALGGEGIGYPRFVEELAGAVEAASYQAPARPGQDEVIVADAVQARGVGFRAVALLGLAEGEFPAPLHEDPFLRDEDRRRLSSEFGLDLELSTASAEAEFFYQAVTRPRERLLLTRPRLADGGALWQPSPFWEEVRRLVWAEPLRLTSESLPRPSQAASWPELLESLAARAGGPALRVWAAGEQPARLQALEVALQVLLQREQGAGDRSFDGNLNEMAADLAQRFGPRHAWSASRLEAYRACPFLFFVGSVLELEPRQEPEEGLNVQQRGTLYHRILERVYQNPHVADKHDAGQLLAVLPEVARTVLDAAPEEEGFRETEWWLQTRKEIEAEIGRTLAALSELPAEYVPARFEVRFGFGGEPALVAPVGGDSFRLHGIIDRVDRSADGQVRLIDYKSGGLSTYTLRAVMEGKRLQLPLYALAARDALHLGVPAEGFYWSVRQAEASPFRLSGGEGPGSAMRKSAEKAWEAVQGVRDGQFSPDPPEAGCPAWCAARGFCWRYRPGFEG